MYRITAFCHSRLIIDATRIYCIGACSRSCSRADTGAGALVATGITTHLSDIRVRSPFWRIEWLVNAPANAPLSLSLSLSPNESMAVCTPERNWNDSAATSGLLIIGPDNVSLAYVCPLHLFLEEDPFLSSIIPASCIDATTSPLSFYVTSYNFCMATDG